MTRPMKRADTQGGGLSAPVRVQLRRTKGWRMPPNTVKVSRPSPFGNYAGATREAFEQDLVGMSNADRSFYLGKVEELRGKNLACWCAVDQPCHADVLLDLANRPRCDDPAGRSALEMRETGPA